MVNLDLPKDPETYLHRIGRTGRYGTTGLAVNIVDKSELKTIEILQREYHLTIQELSGNDKVFSELTDHSKNRHHERPLQAEEDKDQFKKLESERVERKAYVPGEDGPEDETKDDSVVMAEMLGEDEATEAQDSVGYSAPEEPTQSSAVRLNSSRRSRKRQHSSRSSKPTAMSFNFDMGTKRQRLTEVPIDDNEEVDEQEEYIGVQLIDHEREGTGEEEEAYYHGAEQYHSYIPYETGYEATPRPPLLFPFDGVGEYAGRYNVLWYPSDPYAHYYRSAYYHQPAVSPYPTQVFFPPDLVLFPASPFGNHHG